MATMPQEPDDIVDSSAETVADSSQGETRPTIDDQEARTLAESVVVFAAGPAAALRKQLVIGFFAMCAAFAVATASLDFPGTCAAVVGLAVMTLLSYFVVTGIAGTNSLFVKVTRFIIGGGVWDWLVCVFGLAMVIGALVILDALELGLGVTVVAVGLALSVHLRLDRQVAAQQRKPIRRVEEMLMDMRRRGVADDTLRQFVCEQAGNNWEPFYEAMFGYEAKLEARRRWGSDELGRMRPKHKAWRDTVVNWIDARTPVPVEAPAEASPPVETQPRQDAPAGPAQVKPSAPGAEATPEGGVAPDAIAAAAAATAAAQAQTPAPPAPAGPPSLGEQAARTGRPGMWPAAPQMSEEEHARRDRKRAVWGAEPSGPLGFLLGARMRFVIGVLLLGACVLWMQQNKRSLRDDAEQIKQQLISEPQDAEAQPDAPDATGTADTPKVAVYSNAATGTDADVPDAADTKKDAEAQEESTDVSVATNASLKPPDWLPGQVRKWLNDNNALRWFDGYGVGMAGLILIFSAFFGGIKIAVFMYPAAAAAMFGHRWGVPTMWLFSNEHMGMVLGLGIMMLGVFFGRVRA